MKLINSYIITQLGYVRVTTQHLEDILIDVDENNEVDFY